MSESVAIAILAAGIGSRMQAELPKVLHKVSGKTMLEHVLIAAIKVKPKCILLVLNDLTELITEHAKYLINKYNSATEISIVIQSPPKGTGDAVACALTQLNTDHKQLVVLAADTPLITDDIISTLISTHNHPNPAAVTVLTTTADPPTGYGRILRSDSDDSILKIVEEKDANSNQKQITEINSGVYVFGLDFLKQAITKLSPENAQHELYLTDTIELAVTKNLLVKTKYFSDANSLLGCNNKLELAKINKISNQKILTRHMLAGVTIIDPESTWIDTTVKIAANVTILPGCQLLGDSEIDTETTIGPNTTLIDMKIGKNVTITHTVGKKSFVSDNCIVGPFAHLRENTVLRNNSKIGTFVETKNTSVAENTKIPHLSYVGDTEIGSNSNVGAGVITANYDGVNKNKTTIGENVMIGANTTLVAPVNIADNTYIGAGTTIKKDVPKAALAISSNKQRLILNWVTKKRKSQPKER